MKEEIAKLENLKSLKSRQLQRIRNYYLANIYKGLLNNKSIREIHKDIKRITQVYSEKYQAKSSRLEHYALKLATKAYKGWEFIIPPLSIKKPSKSEKIAFMLGSSENYDDTKSIIYKEINKIEEKGKKQIVKDMFKINRKEHKIFYLCSQHNDCAKDHKDFQGKTYVDKYWRDYVKDADEQDQVATYIARFQVGTIQDIMGKPVWLITRPNCRHYFKAFTISEVVDTPTRVLLKNNDMIENKKKQEFATLSHPTKKQWYTIENINSLINRYTERFEYHKMMFQVNKDQVFKDLMNKDRALINKWNTYLKNL